MTAPRNHPLPGRRDPAGPAKIHEAASEPGHRGYQGLAALDLDATAHLDVPRPRGPPQVVMGWHDVTFLHYRMEPQLIASALPDCLEVDEHDGSGWISVVAFHMDHKRLSVGLPLAGSRFPELNVRTYVRKGDTPGIRFLSMDTPGRLIRRVGRALGFPYRTTDLQVGPVVTDRVPGHAPLTWRTEVTTPMEQEPIDRFLMERYLAFPGRRGRPVLHVHHAPWPVQHATVSDYHPGFLEPLIGDRPPDRVTASPGVDAAAWLRWGAGT